MSIHRYFPHTRDDIAAMLDKCGMESLDDLYADVPAGLKMQRDYDLPAAMTESQVREAFENMASLNEKLICFAGAGFYDHYAPAVINHIISRSEFLTAYTPYQPEISQGTLQYIFEYQTMMSQLTGLPVCNASMYDGSTALAEAMMMTVAAGRKKNRVLVSDTLNPIYREVIDTYAHWHGITVESIPAVDGVTDFKALAAMLEGAKDIAGVMLQTPNYYGILEDLEGVADMVHAVKALLVISSPASTLGVIKSQGEWGADIAAGEAQSLGMPLNFGGPYLGYMCCTKALMRKLPGRIVGATVDDAGQRCYVLTLQAREQHIRREKATSNICSNQGLMTLYASVYLSLMGAEGLREVNEISAAGAHSLAAKLEETGKFKLTYPDRPYLNEFAVTLTEKKADEFLNTMTNLGYVGGVKIADDQVLICVTENRTARELLSYTIAAEVAATKSPESDETPF